MDIAKIREDFERAHRAHLRRIAPKARVSIALAVVAIAILAILSTVALK